MTTNADDTDAPRPLTADELGGIVRTLRELKQWPQETLAALSGLSVGVIQNIEDGEPADVDACRALAHAFQFEDIYAFEKPYGAPSPEEIAHAQEQFHSEHLALSAHVVDSGRELGQLFETAALDCSAPATKLAEEASHAFSALLKGLRDYRDSAEGYDELDKLDRYAEIQNLLDALQDAGISLCCARRDAKLVGQPSPVTIAYVAAYPKGHEPQQLIVPKRVRIAS